jgi:AmmeMemoRadiSam system protein B
MKPRLRRIEMFPTELDGKKLIALRDPAGYAEGLAFLPPPAAFLVSFCDGTRTPAEVCRAFGEKTGLGVTEEQLGRLLDQLDEGSFLDSERFAARRRAVEDEFRASPVRAAAHAGRSYPAARAELEAYLTAFEARADASAQKIDEPSAGAPVGLVAPHIDFHRGGVAYAHAYGALPSSPPELAIVFGTDHNGVRAPFTLTRKDYDTPLGRCATDGELVDALVRSLGGEGKLFLDEAHHRKEHSVEFQAVWLRRAYGERTPPILPILCGSLHHHAAASPMNDPGVRDFLGALGKLVAGRRVLVVAGADLAHVGPRFGDGPMGGEESRREVKTADDDALAACARGDAEGFFSSVGRIGDRYRICGLSPIYATLALLGGKRAGRLLAYDQCDADEESASFVSIASVAL